ncbi:hypothetical protein [Terrabacter terrigena]|uniref:Uncharacterized protein n=1 Tax=Terrabacter terrigena TaxID=574718 RepID=A0ABW3MYM6_9MICO
MYDRIDPITARNQLAALHSRGATPDPEAKAAAQRTLATAKIDKAIREALAVAPGLDDAHVGHLVGLILNASGVDGETSIRVERDVRAAVVAAQGGEGK